MKKTDNKDIHNLSECLNRLEIPIFAEKNLEKIQRLCNEPLNLAVVGEFNAGKSSFINILLSLDGLLPTSILPKTATITKLKYSENFSVEIVENKDGNTIIEKSDDFETLKKYQNAKDIDENFQNNIKEIIISLKNEILQNFTFIDTPGFNHDEKMSDITRSIYPEVDIFIWLLNAEQPASGTEIKELQELEKLHKEVFFIVNKSDKKEDDDDELKEGKEFIKKQLPESFKESPIYFISSKSDYTGKYKENLDNFRRDLKNEALDKDVEITIKLLKEEIEELKNNIRRNIAEYRSIKDDLENLDKELSLIRNQKEIDFIEYRGRTNELSGKIQLVFKKIEDNSTKYKKSNNFLRKYILEQEFNENISKLIINYFSPTIDKISKYSKEIKEFVEKDNLKDFEESKLILKFIDDSLIHIKSNIYPFSAKGMIYNQLMSNNHFISEEILEEVYLMDELTAFKFTIDYLDELLFKLDNTLDINIRDLQELEQQLNKFKWSKDAL